MIWTVERKQAAIEEAARWLNVPHVDRMCLYPVGIDCAHYLREILAAAGIVDRRPLGTYRTRIGMHAESDLLARTIVGALHVEEIPLVNLPFGAIIVMKTGQRSAHCAWYVPGWLFHSLAGKQVVHTAWNHWKRKAERAFRIVEIGWKGEPLCPGKTRA